MIARTSRRNSCAAIRVIAPPIVPAPRPGGRAPRFAGSLATGGWSFAVDPDARAEQAPALWRPELCPSITIAAPAPSGFPGPALSDVAASGGIAAEWLAYREWHLVLAIGGRRYRLWIADCVRDEVLAYVVPADDHVPERQAATGALHGWIMARSASLPPGQPGPTERWRLVQWLRLLDALDEKIAPRDLAATLILPDAGSYSAAEWDASSERRRLARWQRSAIAMRDGGYLALLAGG